MQKKSGKCRSQTVKPPILPPAFMRGVPEGRGESAYLHSKYAKMPTFHRKVGTPLRPGGSGLCPNPPAHLPHKWGRQEFFDTGDSHYRVAIISGVMFSSNAMTISTDFSKS